MYVPIYVFFNYLLFLWNVVAIARMIIYFDRFFQLPSSTIIPPVNFFIITNGLLYIHYMHIHIHIVLL